MTATDDDTQKVPTGRDAVDRLRSQGALDGLFEQIDVGQVKMTGADGLLPALVKEALERGLAAELTEHLGYEKGEPTSQARSNARNGTTPKTVDSEAGPFETGLLGVFRTVLVCVSGCLLQTQELTFGLVRGAIS